jgi:cytochrome c-type biogenesis protein CcmH
MIPFLIGAALVVALALAFLLWPLLRRPAGGAGRDRAIIPLYREQLAELAAELKAGTVSADQYESARRDLERRLLDDVAGTSAAPEQGRRPLVTAAAVAVFVVVLPLALYLALGNPGAINPPAATEAARGDAGGKGAAHQVTPEQVQAMVEQLEKRLEQNPQDAQGWAMLARTRSYLRDFPGATKAFARAAELTPDDARLLADYADAMAMTQDRKLAGEPMKLVNRALKISPNDLKALALAGSDAFERADYDGAIRYWERAVSSNPDNVQFTDELRAGIQEAKQKGGKSSAPAAAQAPAPMAAAPKAAAAASTGGSGPAAGGKSYVRGQVRLAAALVSKASPNDTLFVFARAADGPKMPLALLKRQVKDLPLEFSLDETMAMMPELNLSKYPTVIIGARVSHGGDAIASSGDLQGFSGPVKVGTSGIQVQIDQVVP